MSSSPRPPIEVSGIWKNYRIGADSSIADRIRRLFSAKTPTPRRIWALEDISFTVGPGEALGVVGKNGAGKSTLLKVLCGVTFPSKGHCRLDGRVAPLIEVGAGFHPELTGRQNIFLNAGILGLSRKEIRDKVDAIVDFSELEEFIDTPVKRYSSGMLARLGFSVSIFVDPDILLVDEVLSVGDLSFVLKSYRMINTIKRRGVPVLLVSHNLQLIRNFCDRAIWLDKGKLLKEGSPSDVCAAYMKSIYSEMAVGNDSEGSDVYRTHPDPTVSIDDVHFIGRDGQVAQTFETGDPFAIEVTISAQRATGPLIVFLTVWQEESGQMLVNHNNVDDGQPIEGLKGTGQIRCRIDLAKLPLIPGVHRLSVSVSENHMETVCDWHERMYVFSVIGKQLGYGAFYPFPTWSLSS